MSATTRVCTRCEKRWPIECFNLRSDKRRRHWQCKCCQGEAYERWYRRNRKRVYAYRRAWLAAKLAMQAAP